jgi:type VI protein secretion system component VasK
MRMPDRVLRRRPSPRTLLAVLIAACLFLPACSTGSEDATTGDDATGAPAAQETGDPAATEQETAAAAAQDAGAPDAGAQDTADMLAGVDFDAEYCEFRAQVLESGLMSADPDPEEMDAFLEQAVRMYEALVEKAPPEIADDVRAIADGVTRQVDTAQNPEEADEMVEGLTDVAEAQDRVSRWEAENC